MIELSNLAIQRRLDLGAKGDTRPRSGRNGDDYLTAQAILQTTLELDRLR